MKKFVTRFLAVAMLVLGACMLHTDANTVLAAETTTENTSKAIYIPVDNVQEYRSGSGYTYPKPAGTEAEGKEDWVFAGWYYQGSNSNYIAYSEGAMSNVTSAYAKYVPAEVLSTKFQVSAGTNAASQKASLRVVTSIDSTSYQKVGFQLKSGRTGVTKTVESTTVFKRIRTATEGLDYGYSPIIFDTEAEYFMTVTVANIKNANFGYSYIATPYWVTLDGTTVYGVTRSAKVSDSYNGIANIPVRLYTDTTVASGTITVTYNQDAFTYQGVEQGTLVAKDVTVTNNNGMLTFTIPDEIPAKPDGMLANLRFKVLDSASSNEVFTITGVNGLSNYTYQVHSVYYDADKGPDTSWYDEFADESEFVIATANDLYGFAELVNSGTLVDKTVYLGADITVNKGTATENGWEKDNASDVLTPWTPIGSNSNYFVGCFDGDGHTISGIYLDDTKTNTNEVYGLFGRVYRYTAVRDFRLKNSYFNLNVSDSVEAEGGYAFLGSIAGLSQGYVESVYSDAYVISNGQSVGGLFGRINSGKTIAAETSGYTQRITDCEFAGVVNVTRPELKAGMFLVGGIGGEVFRGISKISNCHMSGTVNCTYGVGSTDSTDVSVGGFIGRFTDSSSMTIEKSLVTGKVNVFDANTDATGTVSQKAQDGACAFFGYTDTSAATLTIKDSYAASGVSKNGVQFFAAKAFVVTYILNDVTTTFPRAGWDGSLYALAEEATEQKTATENDVLGYANRGNVSSLGIYTDTENDSSKLWVMTESSPRLKSFVDEWMDFGWYDTKKTSGADTFVITTAEELRAFAYASQADTFAGDTVQLGTDIQVNSGIASQWADENNRPAQSWTAIGTASYPFKGTFDGDGHLISGVYLKNNAYYQGLFSYCNGATIRDLRLVNSYFETTKTDEALIGSMVGCVQGASFTMENVYSDAIVKGASREVGGMIGYVGMTSATSPVNMTSCWFDGDVYSDYKKQNAILVGGFIGTVVTGNVSMDICHFTGDVVADYICNSSQGSWRACVGGFIGNVGSGCTATITNSLSAGKINVNWHKNTNGTADAQSDINGCGQFIGYAQGVTQTGQTIYAISTLITYVEYTNNTRDRSGSWAQVSNIIWDYLKNPSALYGGIARFKTVLPFAAADRTDGKTACWAAMEGALPVPATLTDAKGGTVDNEMSGAGTQSSPYVITNAAGLKLFADLSQTYSFEGEYVELGKNIVVNDGKATDWDAGRNRPATSWTPIGTSTSPFMGTFDGDGHSISGVYLRNDGFYQGLFSYCSGATIRDFSLVNSYFEATRTENEALMGSIVGLAQGASFTMENVYSNAIIKSRSMEVGGFIGYLGMDSASSPVNMTSCWYDGDIYVDYRRSRSLMIGGFFGNSATGAVVFDTCSFTGDIVADFIANADQGAWGACVGGFAGSDSASCSIQIKHSLSAGTVDVRWLNNTNGTVNNQDSISRANQFIGYVQNSSSSAQNCYTVTTVKKYVENTGVTSDTSGYGSGMFASGIDQNNFAGIDYSFCRSASELYGLSAQTWTTLPFTADDRAALDGGSAIWAAIEGGFPVPATLAKNPLSVQNAKLSGSGTEEDPYLIKTVANLARFARSSKEDSYAGKYVALGADIVINEGESAKAWAKGTAEPTTLWKNTIGVASDGQRFAGVFDGRNYTISGICFDTEQSSQTYLGLFAATEVGSEVKNLRLENSYFNQLGETSFTGSIAGECRGALSNVYSNAIVTSVSAQTGGIVGRANGWDYKKNASNTEARISQTITNCWYDGTVNMTSTNLASSDTGGIIGSLIQGEWTLTNCLFTGELNSAYAGEGLSYAGGMCGSVWSASDNNASTKEAKLNVTSCVSAGTINTTVANSGHGAGAIVGRLNAQDGIATYLTMSNVFTSRESGAQVVGDARTVGSTTPSVSGYTVWVTSSDRFIGYFKEDTTSAYAGANLDFDSATGWIFRSKGTPVPATFSDVVTKVTEASLWNAVGLSETTFGKVVHYGRGKYVLKGTSTKTDYQSYIDYLVNTAGFKVHASTSDTATYNTILTKADGDWVLNVLYSDASKAQIITIQTGINEVLSPNLIASNVTQSGSSTVSLGMLQLTGSICDFADAQNQEGYEDYYYGNSFVFKLPNGHFIINDGGATNDFDGLIQYLKKLSGISETDTTTKIYVDAWTITHQHSDHSGVVRGFYGQANKAIAAQVCVEAFYVNEPNNRAIDYVNGSLSETLEKQCRGMQTLRTKSGARTPVYSCQTGQRYYFNGITMDVIQSQEQINVADYAKVGASYENGTDYNTTSTSFLFTVNSGQKAYKVLITGDANYVNMDCIMDTYGTSSTLLKGINVYQAPHHGKNTSMSLTKLDNGFTNYLTTGLNGSGYKFDFTLFPCSVYYEVDGKTHEANVYPYAGSANEHLIGLSNGYWNYGSGTVIVTFGSSITSGLQQ